ncbi:hypothetical protein [Candidatus Pyrohabitans sp.]
MGQHYHCSRCNSVFEKTEGTWAMCLSCGTLAVTKVEVTGRHG